MKFNLLIGLVLLLVVAGCCRKGMPSTTTIVSDSTGVKETIRIVKVEIPGDTVTLTKLVECDSNTNKPKPFKASKKSGRATVLVELKNNGELSATSTCDSLQKEIEVKDREIFRLRKELTISKVPDHTPYWYDIAARWVASLFLLIVTGYILYTLNKRQRV